MSDGILIKVTGLSKIKKVLRRIPRAVGEITTDEAQAALEQFSIRATTYPAGAGQTDRAPFSIRGVGRVTGKSTLRVDQPSWNYGQNPGTWVIRIRGGADGNVMASASTDVPYAKFLVSTEHQAGHMGSIGWRKAEDILNELGFSENVSGGFFEAISRRIKAMLQSG